MTTTYLGQTEVTLAYKIGKLDHRVVGLKLFPGLLDWFKVLPITSLESVDVITSSQINNVVTIESIEMNLDGRTANSLLENSAAYIRSLIFENLSVTVDFAVETDLPSLRNLEVTNCKGGTLFFSSILKKSLKSLKLET